MVFLSCGYGTRLSVLTGEAPKPMVPIGEAPTIKHIMTLYEKNGYRDFIIVAGYKSDYVTLFFKNLSFSKSDYTIDLSSGTITVHKPFPLKWKITIVETGLNTMTGGRIKRLADYIGQDRFMLTYGDGISNVDTLVATYYIVINCRKKDVGIQVFWITVPVFIFFIYQRMTPFGTYYFLFIKALYFVYVSRGLNND